jgi:hypothetical protein
VPGAASIRQAGGALMIFQFSTLKDRHRSRARVCVIVTIPCLDQLADLARWEAELAANPVAVESALMARLRSVPDRRTQRGLRHPLLALFLQAAPERP